MHIHSADTKPSRNRDVIEVDNSDIDDRLIFVEQPGDDAFDFTSDNMRKDLFELSSSERNKTVRIAIIEKDENRCLASALVSLAEESGFHALTGLPKSSLEKTVCISDVAFEPSRPDILPALLYLAVRRGRICGRSTVASFTSDSLTGSAALLGLEKLTRARTFDSLFPAAQAIDYAAYRAFAAASPLMQSFLQKQFVSEAIETLERWIERFFKSSWFRAIYAGTLTRKQYIYTLEQQHQYVRYTTRLIAGALSWSSDRELRDHWRHHLEGEVNHELIIEKDLAHLGADVEYAIGPAVPHPMNLQFIMAQESVIGFRRSPVLLMSSAFVAEGFSSHLDQRFIDGLEKAARSWGIDNPRLVTSFISSHINYDGGVDGHWAGTCSVLDRYIKDETQLQEFLSIIRLCMDAFERSYSVYVDDLIIFSAEAETTEDSNIDFKIVSIS